MNGNNSQSKEGFIKTLGHPRKQELATMIFDGAEVSAMIEAGFGRINILEMSRTIKTSVEGMEELNIEIPRKEGDDKPVDDSVDETATVNVDEPTTPSAEEQAAIDSMVDYVITEETVAQFPALPDGTILNVGDTVKLPANHPLITGATAQG